MKLLLVTFLAALQLVSCRGNSSPIEVGDVSWGRDLDAALALSRQSGKPVFALFQEVPGCAGCQQFGKEVLSHPVLVDAIMSEFTPLLIHNNGSGKDAAALKRFSEPAWNYQVVRFFDSAANDIIPRRDRVWDVKGIADRMMATLQKLERPVPVYLKVLSVEHSPQLQQAVFSMDCFWSGEVALGMIEGVVTTRAGFANDREVVATHYDPAVISLPALIAAAKPKGCRHLPTVGDFRVAPASDQKKQLEGTGYAKLSLTPAQATKVNAWKTTDAEKAHAFLAPSQQAQMRQ
jgi:hypothetical protein